MRSGSYQDHLRTGYIPLRHAFDRCSMQLEESLATMPCPLLILVLWSTEITVEYPDTDQTSKRRLNLMAECCTKEFRLAMMVRVIGFTERKGANSVNKARLCYSTVGYAY